MPTDSPLRSSFRSALPVAALLLVGACLTANWLSAQTNDAPLAGGPGGAAPSSNPIPAVLFNGWPAGRNPDLVVVVTGQQHSYLKFCGCSSPQLGGFERRYNFIAKLRERGWPVVAVDLGDLITRQHRGLDAQTLLKYETSMKALEAIGYTAIGVGENEYKLPLMEGLSRFTLQNPNAYPRVLAANLADRVQTFPLNGQQSMIGDWVTAGGKAGLPKVGVVSVAGRSVIQAVAQFDPALRFDDNAPVLKATLGEMDAQKVDLKVLLYHGDIDQARLLAGDPKLLDKLPPAVRANITTFPDRFDVILCLSAEEQPPSRPDVVGKTMIVRIGHRGQHVGVVGVYKTGNATKPYELHYQIVQMGEEYETDKAKEANHPVLRILDNYALEVKNQNFLANTPPAPHPTKQILPPQANVRFAGSEACAGCHSAEYFIWKKTKHSHAYEALTKKAEKPKLRQYDPECVVCHTVGFGYQTGYTDEVKTRHLLHVGCENCHGPAGHHAANPKNVAYYDQLSPWKTNRTELLPNPDEIAKGLDALPEGQKAILLRVDQVCQKCHDIDNDPYFKFEKYWPVIVHGKNGPPRINKVPRPVPAAAPAAPRPAPVAAPVANKKG
jgi:hypothetical protein